MLTAAELQTATITAESARRTEMLQSQVVRETERDSLSADDFARQQNVRLWINPLQSIEDTRFPRVPELINKTNQFNTTTRRWTAAECVAFFQDGGVFHTFNVTDRYTDYGLVGIVMVQGADIVQWVMSCRVIGMDVEQAVLHTLVTAMRQEGAGPIAADLIRTKVNQPCHTLFGDSGFIERDGRWFLDAWATPPQAAFVTVEPPG